MSMTLLAGMAHAETQNGNTPTPTDGNAPVVTQPAPVVTQPEHGSRDDARFECEFFGTFAGKSGGSMRCEARGKYDPNEIHDFLFSVQPDAPVPGEDDFLRFTCTDRDDRPYYSGPISIGVAPAIVDADGDNGDGRLFNTIITGVRTTSPIIVIQDFNAKRNHDESSSSDERSRTDRAALVTFNWFGSQIQLPGACRIRRAGHGGER